jgi:flagellar protein FlbD
MIPLTRLNNQSFVLNAELIKFIEATPDTMVTLTTGERLLVKETCDEVVRRVVQYGRMLRRLVEPT